MSPSPALAQVFQLFERQQRAACFVDSVDQRQLAQRPPGQARFDVVQHRGRGGWISP